MRAAVLGLIQNDDDIMKTTLETVTQAIVKKLVDSPNFLEKLAKNFLKNGIIDNIKQDIYESSAVEMRNLRNLERCVVDLERANKELRDDSDTQEQYNRRNCLLLHGVSEEQTDSDEAVLSVCNGKLGLQLTSDCIDRSHLPQTQQWKLEWKSTADYRKTEIVRCETIDLRCKAQAKMYRTDDYRERDKTANGIITESAHS